MAWTKAWNPHLPWNTEGKGEKSTVHVGIDKVVVVVVGAAAAAAAVAVHSISIMHHKDRRISMSSFGTAQAMYGDQVGLAQRSRRYWLCVYRGRRGEPAW